MTYNAARALLGRRKYFNPPAVAAEAVAQLGTGL
jgi:hypothetical protein